MRLLALGGCGGMGRFAVRAALADDEWEEIVVADRDGDRAISFARECGTERVRALRLDVRDEPALQVALAGMDAVLAAVGPTFHLGASLLRAAITAGAHYVDLDDDWESTPAKLALDGAARAADVTALVGMGASPGITNLLAVLAARELDRPETLHTIWGLGEHPLRASADTAPGEGGSFGAATEHWLRQLTGPIRTLRDGALVESEPLAPLEIDCPGAGKVVCRAVGHPEPVTFARSFPGLRHAVNAMDLPEALVRLAARSAARVASGELALRDAAARVDEQLARAQLDGPFSRVGLGLLIDALARRRHLPALCAFAEGETGGRRMRVGAALVARPEGGRGALTGIPAAIALRLVARGEVLRRGVVPPEQGVDPELFFRRFAPYCEGLPRCGLPLRVERADGQGDS